MKNELSAFIHVRYFLTSEVPKNSSTIPKGKGKLEAAVAGENNLILAAFNARNKPIILPRPETDDDGNVVVDEEEVDVELNSEDVVMVVGEGRNVAEDPNAAPPRLIADCPPPPEIVTPRRLTLFHVPPS